MLFEKTKKSCQPTKEFYPLQSFSSPCVLLFPIVWLLLIYFDPCCDGAIQTCTELGTFMKACEHQSCCFQGYVCVASILLSGQDGNIQR